MTERGVNDRRVLVVAGVLAVAAIAAGVLLADRARRVALEREAQLVASVDTAFGDAARRQALQAALDSLAREAAGTRGRAAIAVRDVRTGAQLLAGDTAATYPMMSVYKVPIAVAVFADVAEGKLSLQDTVEFRAEDVRAFRSPLSERAPRGGERLTIGALLALAVTQSDNAASDRLLGLVGGPAAVTARLRQLGVEGVRVDRSERELALDMLGVEGAAREGVYTRAQWDSIAAAAPDERLVAALDAYVDDERDTATPAGAIELFGRLARQVLLPLPLTQQMLELMREPAGEPRLRPGIPAGATVWSKGGTSLRAGGRIGAWNDVAIVERPDGRRRVIVLLVTGSEVDPERLRAVAAEVGRLGTG